MIKIEVSRKPIRSIGYTDKKTGEVKTLRIQEAYAFVALPDGTAAEHPDKFEIVLGRDQDPYPPGTYALSPAAVWIDAQRKLRISPVLRPVTQGTPKPAQAAS